MSVLNEFAGLLLRLWDSNYLEEIVSEKLGTHLAQYQVAVAMGYTLEIIPKYLQLQVNPIYDLFVRLKPPEKKNWNYRLAKVYFPAIWTTKLTLLSCLHVITVDDLEIIIQIHHYRCICS